MGLNLLKKGEDFRMKKEKGKIGYSIFTVLITFFLIINLFLQNSANKCETERGDLFMEIITSSVYLNLNKVESVIKQQSAIDYLINEEQGYKFSSDALAIINSLPQEVKSLQTNIGKELDYIEYLQNQLNIKNCRKKQMFANGFLFIALIFSLITVGYGFEIYKLYKIKRKN
jgi:hypothetical protein